MGEVTQSVILLQNTRKLIPVPQGTSGSWSSQDHSEVSWRMKVGLIPSWARPSSGTAMASWSLLPLSIPLLIFSGNIVASEETSWGTWAKGGVNVRRRGGEGTSLSSCRKGDPAVTPTRKGTSEGLRGRRGGAGLG